MEQTGDGLDARLLIHHADEHPHQPCLSLHSGFWIRSSFLQRCSPTPEVTPHTRIRRICISTLFPVDRACRSLPFVKPKELRSTVTSSKMSRFCSGIVLRRFPVGLKPPIRFPATVGDGGMSGRRDVGETRMNWILPVSGHVVSLHFRRLLLLQRLWSNRVSL